MANRRLNQFRFSHEPALVDVFCRIAIGAAGAPTLIALQNRGVASVTRISAGRYSILLQDSYARFMHMHRSTINPAGVSAAPGTTVISESVATLASPTVVIECNTGGVATDPGNGEMLLIQLVCKNSSA